MACRSRWRISGVIGRSMGEEREKIGHCAAAVCAVCFPSLFFPIRLLMAPLLAVSKVHGTHSLRRKTSAYHLDLSSSFPCGAYLLFLNYWNKDRTDLSCILSCGQIMYSWLLRPDTIPRSYSTWISQASKVSESTVLVNRAFARRGQPDPSDMRDLLDGPVSF